MRLFQDETFSKIFDNKKNIFRLKNTRNNLKSILKINIKFEIIDKKL